MLVGNIYHGASTNQIARLPAIVVKSIIIVVTGGYSQLTLSDSCK
jgi:hypothetical protein